MLRHALPLLAAALILTPLSGLWAETNPVPRYVHLADNGAIKCVIVTPPRATRSAKLGAAELQYHLKLITGAEPAIQTEDQALPAGLVPIYVGACKPCAGLMHDAGSRQEHHVVIGPDSIRLVGHDEADYGDIAYDKNGAWPGISIHSPTFDVGTLYAVYDFLEKACGVRWYMPGDLGTVAPSAPSLTIQALTIQATQPWTKSRVIGNNSWGKPGTFGRPDSMGYVRPSAWGDGRDAVLYMLRMRSRCSEFGFSAHPFTNYSKYYGKTHPEYFVDSSPGPVVQLRYGSQAVVDAVTQNVLDYFDGKSKGAPASEQIRFTGGQGNFFLLGPSDTRIFGNDATPPLQPERRRPNAFSDGRASDYWYTFVNKVAASVEAKWLGERWIISSAYASHFEPPSFALAPNVGVYVCGTEGWEPDSYGMENLRAWRQKVSRLAVYEYWYSHGSLPKVRPHTVAAYVKQLRELGVEGWFMEMISGSNAVLYHLDYYVNMRLLYDPDADVDQILNEYYTQFYGPAAKPMQAFWTALEEADKKYRRPELNRVQQWLAADQDGFLQKLDTSLTAAEKLATADPYAARLKLIRTGVRDMLADRISEAKIQDATPIPEMTVTRAKVNLTIDGKLDDAAWQNAPKTTPFIHMTGVKPATEDFAKVLWDGDNLYIGFEMMEPNMETQKRIHKTSSSGICMDDSVEVFVDPGHRQPNGRDYLQAMLTADGVAWRYYWGKAKIFAEDMPELGIQAASWRGPDRWTCELKIPLKPVVERTDGVGMPHNGDLWGIGLYRNRRSEFKATIKDRFARGATGWSATFGGFHVATRFGQLKFAE